MEPEQLKEQISHQLKRGRLYLEPIFRMGDIKSSVLDMMSQVRLLDTEVEMLNEPLDR